MSGSGGDGDSKAEDRLILLANLGDSVDDLCLEDGDVDGEKPEDGRPNNLVYLASCVAAMGGLLLGYDMGIISGAKTQMQKDLNLTCSNVEWAVTMLPVGAFVASMCCGLLVDKFGRKNTIIVNAQGFTLGALLVCFSGNLTELLIGRFVIGFAMSVSAIAECIYISEISTSGTRGRLVSLNELAITVGILLAFLSNYCFAEFESGWRIMFGMGAAAALVQGLAMSCLPKTPHYLMLCQKEEEAEETIRRLNLSANPRQTVADIRSSISSEESPASSIFFCCTKGETNMAARLGIGCGLVLFQQFTGQPNIIYYAADVFRLVGFCGEMSSTLASVGLGSMKVLSTVVSLNLVDRIGRKKALCFGLVVMGISIFGLAAISFYDEEASNVYREACHETAEAHVLLDKRNSSSISTRSLLPAEGTTTLQSVTAECLESQLSSTLRYLAFVSLVSFVCAFSFSFGPVTWLILSEIYPPSTKGRAMAFSTAVNWLGNIVVSSTFIQATAAFTIGGVFLFYSAMCALGLLFVGLLVPETKNKSLEEISKELARK